MDIKLKNKLFRIGIVLLICLTGIYLCLRLYRFVDTSMNGTFADWFDHNYMISKAYTVAGETIVIRELNWPAFKGFILSISCLFVIICTLLTYGVSRYYANRKTKDTISKTGDMIHFFMNTSCEASTVFPSDYAEISIQMTEIKSAMQNHEMALKEEAARKNDLITYLAHDLKTPLTSVIGYLSLLNEAPDMPTEQRAKYVHIALDKAYRLEQLTNEFFEITRYNLQQISLETETIDLYYMLVQMTDEFYPILQNHGSRIELNVPEDMTVYGDAAKLARVFNNILKNAVAYSYPGTPIRIWAKEENDSLLIYFQNNGKTIPAHKLDTIFEKFFRLDEARTSNTGGAGLGLAIAREIVTLHGGTITAESREEQTCFCVSLPLHSRNADAFS